MVIIQLTDTMHSSNAGRAALLSFLASMLPVCTTGAFGANLGARKIQYREMAISMGRRAFIGSVSATVKAVYSFASR